MSKVVKLKISDIEKIVKNVINESEAPFDDFDTKIQPEELPGYEDYEAELTLAQDEQGNFYVIKDASSDNPEIVAQTK